LIDYAQQISKQDISPLSLSRTIRQLLASELTGLNYYPIEQKKKQKMLLRSLMEEREGNKINDGNDPFALMQQEIWHDKGSQPVFSP
jgi:hypothetical protein